MMATAPIKERPARDIQFVLHPERDAAYVHFEHAATHPFRADASALGRRNAWWLADAALLAYWDPTPALTRFRAAGLQGEQIAAGGLQCYVVSAADFVIVAFRGTEADEWQDVLDDKQFIQVPWDRPGTHVHRGFKGALDRVWPTMSPILDGLAASRTVWFTGHSLGAALAMLAADRFARTAGVCTIGCPRVGDIAFSQGFDTRFGLRALRYVFDTDIVTHVPPPLPFPFPYKHAGALRQISAEGQITSEPPPLQHFFSDLIGDPQHVLEVVDGLQRGALLRPPKFLLDHMPRGYAVDIWNAYARNAD
jgi:triacylglycerol lipase